ncbi:hypothetical protein [Manganibacter manganicus]|uniref:Glycerophosphotransferase n=1 Tax=Manganibacter manganicus TaxID=1873176 RepID=A0A1V8RMQ4_9HYPH|nr:hypothetical protein [Pseudaminobacter manganicus]OQM74434.1 hypothetical protein BFN67_22015 [Pseudaminobacter manganicus]
MKVVFLYLAQFHQVLHTFPIAMEMARSSPDIEVHLAAATPVHLAYMRELSSLYPDAKVSYDLLYLPAPVRRWMRATQRSVSPKKLTLLLNLRYLRGFDGIVVPERTSLFLRKFDMRGTRLIWTGHGAGDRGSGFTANVGQFDFVLLPGEKLARRHKQLENVSDDGYGIGGYAKFDLVEKLAASRPPLFDNGRKTVVYNPHFWPSLSSWHRIGFNVLDFFAESREYNLIFAPHLRLFDPPRAEKYAPFEKYRGFDHMKIDLGSTNSIDMTYTLDADIYLGDVSSQIAEFMLRPRPAVFLNTLHVDWRDDPNYRFWQLGVVTDGVEGLRKALAVAVETHPAFEEKQRAYFEETYQLRPGEPSAPRGAAVIADYLRRQGKNAPAASAR